MLERKTMRLGRIAAYGLLALTANLGAFPLGTDWHSDPDGDGVLTGSDSCPWVVNIDQSDADGDGVGDACDPDFRPPQENGPVTDLVLEHVTLYGGWFGFTSPRSETWGWSAVLAWTTDRSELESVAGVQAVVDRGDSVAFSVSAGYGERHPEPVIVTAMEPATTYYAAIVRDEWNGLTNEIGNIVTFTTPAAAVPRLDTGFPRVWSTAAQIAKMQERRAAGDSGWATWEPLLRPRILQAVADPGSVYRANDYCSAAALLHRVTGDGEMLSAALALLDGQIDFWETVAWDGNGFRWADSRLGVCLDLLWDDLPPATRSRAAATIVSGDEWRLETEPVRMSDTDQYASAVRSWLMDGLLLCTAPGLDSALQQRACRVLDAGLRGWYGIQLVKARRDRGFFAQSGGFLPDGSDYGQGTSTYWLQSFWVLHNAGMDPWDHAPFLRNNFLGYFAYSLSPKMRGFVTMGDVEDFSYNFGVEENSFQLEEQDADLLALYMGTFQAAGYGDEAGWARWLARTFYDERIRPESFYALMFDTDEIPEKDYRRTLEPAWLDSGLGLFFDRTSWSGTASWLFFQAGWSYVDHRHADVGHFQLYRGSRWITHEAIGYDGPAAGADGHNVLLLQYKDPGGGTDLVGQFNYEPVGDRIRILRASSSSDYSFVVADTTGAYTSYRSHSSYYDSVQRSLFWLKSKENGRSDLVFLYDMVNNSSAAPAGVVRQMQLQFDAAPTVSGRGATIALSGQPQQVVEIDVLTPASASLSTRAPEGQPDTYPGQIYTHRLMVDPGTSSPQLRLLTVLRAAESAATDRSVEVPVTGWKAALAEGNLVLFPDTVWPWEASGKTDASLDIPLSPPLRIWMAGMEPSAGLTVAATSNGTSLVLTISPGPDLGVDEGGLLAFDVAEDLSITPVEPAIQAFLWSGTAASLMALFLVFLSRQIFFLRPNVASVTGPLAR